MVKPPTSADADAAALVQRSVLFRVARRLFVSIDDAARSSRLIPSLTRPVSVPTAGRLLIVASVVHAALVSAIPLPQAPLWRYSFAVVGLIAGVWLVCISHARSHSKAPEAPEASASARSD